MSVAANNNSKQVQYYNFGHGSRKHLKDLLADKPGYHLYVIDHYFEDKKDILDLPIRNEDDVIWLDTQQEPKTVQIDALLQRVLLTNDHKTPSAIMGVGG